MTGTAVAYVRRSTKDQAQSLERQRHEVQRYATANGITIARWFEDDGISGVEDAARPGFQQMVAAAERREFELILVHEISRFGRFDAFQAGSWLHRLKAARVRVQAIEGTVKDPYSIQGRLMLALEQDLGESVKLSMRTLSGQHETAAKGLRAGGRCPFGYSRLRRRADGKVEDVGRVGIAKRDRSEVVTLVPGEKAEVEAVQTMYRMARDGVGYRTIAQWMNDRGMPSPDFHRRRTMVAVPGRWNGSTVRALLLNQAYAGDLVWNRNSVPKFHRLEGGKIVEVGEFERDQLRRNPKADWIVVRDAHPALVDRALFDAVQQKIRVQRSMPRGHIREYLLTGLIGCDHCGDRYVGTSRMRRTVHLGKETAEAEPQYVCGGTLRAKDRCRRVGLPRDGFERAVLKILEEEIFRPEALARLEEQLRQDVARRGAAVSADSVAALEERERELATQLADGARRMLQVGEELVPELKAALQELKAQHQRIRASLEARRREADLAVDGESAVREALDRLRTMASVLRDPTFALERRKDVLRQLLPKQNGIYPIRVVIDPKAKPGWRRALKRVIVRHLTVGEPGAEARAFGFGVSPAGVEPAACALGKRRSIQLSYGDG